MNFTFFLIFCVFTIPSAFLHPKKLFPEQSDLYWDICDFLCMCAWGRMKQDPLCEWCHPCAWCQQIWMALPLINFSSTHSLRQVIGMHAMVAQWSNHSYAAHAYSSETGINNEVGGGRQWGGRGGVSDGHSRNNNSSDLKEIAKSIWKKYFWVVV